MNRTPTQTSLLLCVALMCGAGAGAARAQGKPPARPAAAAKGTAPPTAPLGDTPAAETAEVAGDARAEAILADDTPIDPGPSPSKGIGYYEELARQKPQDAQTRQLLAAMYSALGRTDDARREAKRAIELEPLNPEMHQALGLVDEKAGRFKDAEAALRKAMSLDGNVEYRFDLARILHASGRYQEEKAEYQKLATEFATMKGVQLALADAHKDAGRYDEAVAAYDRALQIEPGNVDVLVEKGRMLADKGDNASALEVMLTARAAAPKDIDVHYNLGIIYIRAGQLDAAIASLSEATKLAPADDVVKAAKAWNNLGVAQDKLKKPEDALASFRKAAQVDGDFADAHYNAGLEAFKLTGTAKDSKERAQRFKDAQASFERALEVDADMSDAKFYLGEIYFQLGDTSKALRVYKEALRMKPEDAGTHRRLGDIYLSKGEIDLAVGEYWAAVDSDERLQDNRAQLMRVLVARNADGDVRRAVKLGERGVELDAAALDTRIALAQAESVQGRSVRGRQILEDGVRVTPKDPRVHVALGRMLLEQGKSQEAETRFSDALKLDAKNPEALAGDAEAALARGDRKKAKKRLAEALSVNPSMAAARADLGRLYFEDKENDLALKELEQAVIDDPKLGKAWFYLAFAQNKAGKTGEVEASLKKAVAAQPDLAEAHLQLGKLLLQQDRKEDAKKAFESAVRARSNYEEALLQLELLQGKATP